MTFFEWDEFKNRVNKDKHKVSFEEAQLAFLDKRRIIAKDLEHSETEGNSIILGK